MSETLQNISIIVLAIAIGFAINSLYKKDKNLKMNKEQKESEDKRGEHVAQIAENDKEYMAFVHKETGVGNEYDPDQWHFKMPDSALKHLEACFEGDKKKVYLMKRAIELSIEHFAIEMADDAECARIIEERVFKNPQAFKPLDINDLNKRRKSVLDDESKKD